MRIIKIILIIIAIPVALFILFLIHSTMADFQPKEVIRLGNPKLNDTIRLEDTITIMTWNIGYAGLDANMDFFYDGGEKVRPGKNQVIENFNNIENFISKNDSVKFIFIQEIDKSSKRSYHINEFAKIREILDNYTPYFGKNYDVDFVPVPVFKPMGKVLSGIATFSQEKPYNASRYSFPGNYAWPTKLFMLDRCFLVCRFKTNNEKDFILINTHNSAYDDGTLRKQQMEYLRSFILNEFNSGNYILVGGDWNQSPPDLNPKLINQPFDTLNKSFIPKDFLPESWKWAYDPYLPTNRRVTHTYVRGETLTTVIDFFLLSPNIELININTIDLGFKNSDHQPVIACFMLKD